MPRELTPSMLFEYCLLAQREGGSRGMAFRVVAERFPDLDRVSFQRVWAVARTAQRLVNERASVEQG